MSDEIMLIVGGVGAFLVYQYIQQQNLLTSITSTIITGVAISYAPTGNINGDEFSCPSGTKFYPSETSVNGQGYCQ